MRIYDRRKEQPGYKGNKPYVFDYRDQHGKRHSPGFRLKEEAEKEFARVQRLKGNHWHPSAEAAFVTFGQALDEYLAYGGLKFDQREHREDKWEASTLALKEDAVRLHVRPALGSYTLASLVKNPQPLRDLISELERKGHISTPENVASIINGVIGFAMNKKAWLTHNFLLDRPLEPSKKRVKRKTMPTSEQFAALMTAVRERQPNEKRYAFEYRQLIFALALFGAFNRRAEMAALHWEDLIDGQICIRRTYNYQHHKKTGELFKPYTKTDDWRWVDVDPLISAALLPIWERQGRPEKGLIMRAPCSGKPIYGQMRDMFLYTMKKAGLTTPSGKYAPHGIGLISLHGLRALGESMHLQHGAPMKAIAARAGHSEHTLRKHYEYILPSDDRASKVSAEISARVGSLMLPPPGTDTVGDAQYRSRQRKAGNRTATKFTEGQPQPVEIRPNWVKDA